MLVRVPKPERLVHSPAQARPRYHQLWRGLVLYVPTNEGGERPVMYRQGGQQMPFVSTGLTSAMTWQQGPEGLYLAKSDDLAANRMAYDNVGASDFPQSAITVVLRYTSRSVSPISRAVCQYRRSDGNGWFISESAVNLGSYTSQVESTTGISGTSSSAAQPQGVPLNLCVRWVSGSATQFLVFDGAQLRQTVTSLTSQGGVVQYTNGLDIIYGGALGDYHGLWIYDRALTDAELRQLAVDPYGMFAARPRPRARFQPYSLDLNVVDPCWFADQVDFGPEPPVVRKKRRRIAPVLISSSN